MPKHEHHKHTKFQPRTEQQETIDDKDTVDAESEKWNPTPAIFEAFLVRDFELATQNVNMIMGARRAPMSLKELKDSTLHSSDVIERVLSAHLAAGFMTEAKGKYSLANP